MKLLTENAKEKIKEMDYCCIKGGDSDYIVKLLKKKRKQNEKRNQRRDKLAGRRICERIRTCRRTMDL